MEASLVSIPADAEALIRAAIADGLDLHASRYKIIYRFQSYTSSQSHLSAYLATKAYLNFMDANKQILRPGCKISSFLYD